MSSITTLNQCIMAADHRKMRDHN